MLELISFALLGIVLVGLFFLIFRKGRRILGAGIVVAAIVAFGLVGGRMNAQKASEAGFASYEDMKAAESAGISDPKEFDARREEVAAAAEARRQAEVAEAAAKKAEVEAAKEAAKAREAERAAKLAVFMAQPSDQVAFIAAVEKARSDVDNAQNDMQKGAIRRERARALCAAVQSGRVEDWTGTIADLTTNSDGLGVVTVRIADDLHVATWNNALSDIGDRTLIDPDSAVFKAFAVLAEGAEVRFSGQLLKGETDCYREGSLTLAGAMDAPKFILRFSSAEGFAVD